MSLGRIVILIAMTVLLSACASTRMGEQLEEGKVSFVAGNFQNSFHELLPVAVYGNREAQYAIGYMYYNGLGVSQDSESGVFWMTKSAEKGYAPARKALEQIASENIAKAKKSKEIKLENKPAFNSTAAEEPVVKPIQPFRTASASTSTDTQKDEVLQSLVSAQLLAKVHNNPSSHLNVASQSPKPQSPVHHSGAKASYTLQLYGSYTVDKVKDLQQKLTSQKLTRSWHTKREGKDWFVLTYGEFKTVSDARVALKNLPEPMRAMEPWVRPLGQLEIA